MPTTSNVACVACGAFMRCSKTGMIVEELDSQEGPYKIWSCDEFACPHCGTKVVLNFGRGPIAEQWQPEYAVFKSRVVHRLR